MSMTSILEILWGGPLGMLGRNLLSLSRRLCRRLGPVRRLDYRRQERILGLLLLSVRMPIVRLSQVLQ